MVETFGNRVAEYGKLTFPTMPERLQAAGVSWKVYNDRLGELALSPLPYFKAFTDPFSVTGVELVGRGLTPHFPDDFAADVRWNRLPAVSWIVPPLAQCEHPAAPPGYGEYLVHSVLSTLVSNPAVWAQTVLFVVHDENGGFFDHVAPVAGLTGSAPTAWYWVTVMLVWPLKSSGSGLTSRTAVPEGRPPGTPVPPR
ncbi:MAG: alkaline phosphatase family protein [Streptosporangiaceae bacterium]